MAINTTALSTRIAPTIAERSAPRDGDDAPPAHSLPRETFEHAVGALFSGAATVLTPIPSAVAGGVRGLQKKLAPAQVGLVQSSCAIAVVTTAAAAIGGIAGGPIGAGVGAAVGATLSSLQALVMRLSGGDAEMGGAISAKVDEALGDNAPSDNPTQDGARDFTESALVSLHTGLAAGRKVGYEQGSGIASGLIEGTRGAWQVFTGSWDPDTGDHAPSGDPNLTSDEPSTPPDAPRHGLLRRGAEMVAGVASGVVGSALVALDGAVQGLGQGASHTYEGSTTIHHRVVEGGLAASGLAVGACLGGPIGGLVGAVAGFGAGKLVSLMQSQTGSDQAVVDSVSLAVSGAATDDTEPTSAVYRGFRDGVQGAMVGAAAGVRTGYANGYEGGSGMVGGMLDGLHDIWKGILDGLGHKPPAPPAPPSQQP